MPRSRLTIAFLVMAVLALAGCGTQTLDGDKIETEVASGIEQQTDAEDVTVECPEDVEIEAGAKFECTASAGGDEAPVEITQSDDEGNITWRLNPKG